MYDQFYGLSGRPFQLTPDPHFYFESGTHRKAMSYLGYGLAQGEGFIVITGEIGSGKSTLVAYLMDTIDKGRLNAVKLVSTRVDGDDMLRLVAQQFELPSENVSKAELIQSIEFYLHDQARQGKRSLLIVDEAQNLSENALEELRMLSNFQLGGHPLLQIFLLGQPEFRTMLQMSSRLEQLRQRVIATHHLTAMEFDEVEPYVIHRLSKVGWTGDPQFVGDAYHAMYEYSQGIPRKLNMLANRVLLLGAVEELHEFNGDDIRAVIADMDEDSLTYEGDEVYDLDEPEYEPQYAPALGAASGGGMASLLATKVKRHTPPILADAIEDYGHNQAAMPDMSIVADSPINHNLVQDDVVDGFDPEPFNPGNFITEKFVPANFAGGDLAASDFTGNNFAVDNFTTESFVAGNGEQEVHVAPSVMSSVTPITPDLDGAASGGIAADSMAGDDGMNDDLEDMLELEQWDSEGGGSSITPHPLPPGFETLHNDYSAVFAQPNGQADIEQPLQAAPFAAAPEKPVYAAPAHDTAAYETPVTSPDDTADMRQAAQIAQSDEMREMAEKMEELEARLADQDAALRRMLTLLVNFVEDDAPVTDAVANAAGIR